MNDDERLTIVIVTLVISFCFVGVFLLGGIVHEIGHALACRFFNVPFKFSILYVETLVPVSGIVKIIIGLSGGIAEALGSILCFWLVTFMEKRNSTWFSVAIGFEMTFLAMFFLGITNSIFEGFFYEAYRQYNTDLILWFFLIAGSASFFIVKKWKWKKLKRLVVAESL